MSEQRAAVAIGFNKNEVERRTLDRTGVLDWLSDAAYWDSLILAQEEACTEAAIDPYLEVRTGSQILEVVPYSRGRFRFRGGSEQFFSINEVEGELRKVW